MKGTGFFAGAHDDDRPVRLADRLPEPRPEPDRTSYAYRLGEVTMLARLYLVIPGEDTRRALVAVINREMPAEFYEPLK